MQRNLYLLNGARLGRKMVTVLGASALIITMSNSGALAQSVGIAGSVITPRPNSMLEIRSIEKGFLVPRMTEAQRNAINGGTLGNTSAADTDRGMMVYQYDGTPGYYYWNGTSWVRLLDTGGATGWLLTGNAATTPGTNYIGTSDNEVLRFKTNSFDAFDISSAPAAADGGRLRAYQDGTAASPLFSWNADSDMGIYRIGADILGFSTSGAEAMRIGTNGHVGIGLTAAPTEKLEIGGNVKLTRVADRTISVAMEPSTSTNEPAKGLTILAGHANNDNDGFPQRGGDLVLQAGSGYVNSVANNHGGHVVIRTGANRRASSLGGIKNGGDIIMETGGVNNVFTERFRFTDEGVWSLNGFNTSGANRLLVINSAGVVTASLDPATISGTVSNIATGAGLTGGAITSTGTISMADMGALTVKGNPTNALAAPTDIAAGTDHQVFRRSGTALGFGAIALNQAAAVTGTLAIANGGTNSTVVPTAGALAYGTGTAYAFSAAGTVGNVLVSGGAGAPTWSTTAALMQDLTIQNGLRLDAGTTYDGSTARTIKLGGPLTETTSIDKGGFVMSIGGNGNLNLNVNAGASITSIGSGTTTGNVVVGQGDGSQNVFVRSGASGGGVIINESAAGYTNIGTGNTTANVTIGGSSAQTISIGNGAANKTVNLGSSNGTSTTTILSGTTGVRINANTAANTPVDIASGTTTGNVVIGNATGFIGIGGAVNASYKMTVTGKVKSTGINETSDERLKKNFESIEGSLDKVMAMAGKYYDWRISEFPNLGLSEGRQVGVIAQEMEKILPEVVTTGEDGFKAVEYGHIVPVLIEAIKEQQAIIAGQQEKLTALEGVKSEMEMLKASIELLNEHIRTSQK